MGKRVEAKKPVPQLGTSWDEWSQWRNRLPHEEQEVACCETHLVGPSGGRRTPEAAWVLDRSYPNFAEDPFHALR